MIFEVGGSSEKRKGLKKNIVHDWPQVESRGPWRSGGSCIEKTRAGKIVEMIL